jgi:hypothetical protein
MSAIFENYNDWKQCLNRNLGKDLTKKYTKDRAHALRDNRNSDTLKFIQVYGQDRATLVAQWFEKLSEEMEDQNSN